MVKKSISITDQQDKWVKAQIISGNYGNESEVIRDLIRKEQIQYSRIEAIRIALIEGEQSGISNRSIEDIKDAVLRAKNLK